METQQTGKLIRRLDSAAVEVLVAVNAKAGARARGQVVDRLLSCLKSFGLRATVVSDVQQLQALAAAGTTAGTLRAVVACGGDGTAGLVVNRSPVGVPVAILPLGTENLLAKYLQLTCDPSRLARLIKQGAYVRLDAGLANGMIFLLMTGCGFDAEVVRRMHALRTGHITHLSYLKPILDSIRTYQYPELRITPLDDDGRPVQSPLFARWAFVANLPRYAGGLGIVPGADGTDGQLDVCTLRGGSFLSGLVYLGGVLAGQHHTWQDCVTLRARRVRIESDGRVPFQLDGDPGGYLPVDIHVLPQRLTLIVPEDWRAAD